MAEVYPSTLAGVLYASLSVRENQAFRTNDSDIGPATYELLSEDVPTVFNVGWRFYAFDFQVFENWFKHTLIKGVKSFTIDLPVGAGILEHECNFVAPYSVSYQGRIVNVTAKLRAIEKQHNTEAEYDDLLLMAAMTTDKNKAAFFEYLIEFTDTVLPDSWEALL